MVLVSKQHEVTIKYKMQATPHFSIICKSGVFLDFQVTCPAGHVAVETIFEACKYNIKLSTNWKAECGVYQDIDCHFSIQFSESLSVIHLHYI